ncbi:MAG: hypothetical protein Q4E06_03755 [Lautropia sp.]|nr:hypothetical protein [Lautropia sp.]
MRRIPQIASPVLLATLMAGCANTINEDDPHAPIREEGRAAVSAGSAQKQDPAAGPTTTVRHEGKPDWAAVYETPPGTRYREQQLIYVDRNSLHEHKLGDKLTYYTATTRELHPASGSARIQELAVLCEGAPIAPATSLRGEGSENRDGSYRLQRAKTPITSLEQFSTQRIPIDPKVPSTFVVRAICLLGTDPHR